MAVIGCLVATVSQAGVGPAHHHHADSPFVGQQDAQHRHCVLKGHSLDRPCPHMMDRGNNGQPMIASDCGGTSSPSNSHRIGSENIFSINARVFDGNLESQPENFFSDISFYHRLSFHSLAPPPKSL